MKIIIRLLKIKYLFLSTIIFFTACGEESTTVKKKIPPAANEKTILIKKTGQIKSYDTNGNEVLNGALKDNGYYKKGILPSYIRDNSQETITDKLTGLIWQDDVAVTSVKKQWLTMDNYSACASQQTSNTCFDTKGDTAKTYCEELNLGSFNDWRLPTRKELQSLVDYGRFGPAINSTFQHTSSHYYWTSTTHMTHQNEAWTVDFYSGQAYNTYKVDYKFIRCVRNRKEF